MASFTRLSVIWITLCLLILLTYDVSNTNGEISSRTKEQIKAGFDAWGKVCSAIPKDTTNELFKFVGKMAPFLGAAGGLVSFILTFLPKKDSPELAFMKQEFAKVNTKLDKITTQLDHLENLLEYEVQRAAYITAANKITFGFIKLNEFFNELQRTECGSENECARVRENILSRFSPHFNIQAELHMILTGCVSSSSEFNEPLLDVIAKTFKCDVGKLDKFANGVLKLSFKAQMVIVTHEKTTGSNISVVNSMKTWLKSIYSLRSYLDKVKNTCYKDIKGYMLTDINKSSYQTDFGTDMEASTALQHFMFEKFHWLDWNVVSYNAYGGDHHYMLNVYGAFWNSPQSKEKRKRNLVASLVDRSGTYRDQGYWVWNALDQISRDAVCGFGCSRNLEKLLNMISTELKKKNMWKYVVSLNIIKQSIKPSIAAHDPLTYLHKVVTFKERTPDGQGGYVIVPITVHVIISLKSLEMASLGVESEVSACSGHGKSITLPYTSFKECQCVENFDGKTCKEHSKNSIASTIDALIASTLHLHTLVDIYYNVKDLRDEISVGINHIENAINRLRKTLQTSFQIFGAAMSRAFAWVNLQIIYSQSIQHINYYSYRFNSLPNTTRDSQEIQELAKAVLAPDGVQQWVYNLNELFMGNELSPIGSHKPFLMMFMSSHIAAACSEQYKIDVDNVYRQFAILQQKGYIVWAQALDILNMESDEVKDTYDQRLKAQTAKLNAMTCEYVVENSININCTGGRYIHPAMVLTNKCKQNYYIDGESTTTCAKKQSRCLSCNCYKPGSVDLQCEDKTGKCKCKSGFYGDKCENRNCVWTGWSGWSSCSKSCDYGGTQYKKRSYAVTKHGKGRACDGPNVVKQKCFKGCCREQFHCSNRKKCISSSLKCNYNDDCGDKQDESSCQEACSYKYTPWNSHGGGDVYYLDRHNADCGNQQYVMQMFHLERYGGRGNSIRYKYRCCRFNKDIARYHAVSNSWTYTRKYTVYLDRQVVSCSRDSYINGFHLRRNGDHLSYHYYCDQLVSSQHRKRQNCFSSTTPSSYNGKGKNFYLDRQTVDCARHGSRYFLNSFHLRTTGSMWYYEFTCCQLV